VARNSALSHGRAPSSLGRHPYLFLADLQNTALSALLIFYERVLYPSYEKAPHITGMTALEDQAAAGAIMWVLGSIFFLIPVGLITVEVLSTRRATFIGRRKLSAPLRNSLPEKRASARRARKPRASIDLISLPIIGSILRWPHFRRSIQAVMFLLAMIVIVDGLFGPQMGAMNLAGVLPWTHWRGLSVIALLAVGNVFCMACPFNFVRDLGRRCYPHPGRGPGVCVQSGSPSRFYLFSSGPMKPLACGTVHVGRRG